MADEALAMDGSVMKGVLGFSSEERRTRTQSKGQRRRKRKIKREGESKLGVREGERGFTWS